MQRLQEIGFVWDPLTGDWEEGFAALKAYRKREGHCRVPGDFQEDDFSLGQWVGVQRRNQTNLAPERVQRLDEVGFVWSIYTADWEDSLAALKPYREREGHCRVLKRFKEGDFPLGQWVSVQRRNQTNLKAERVQKLDEIGFVWNARKRESN